MGRRARDIAVAILAALVAYVYDFFRDSLSESLILFGILLVIYVINVYVPQDGFNIGRSKITRTKVADVAGVVVFGIILWVVYKNYAADTFRLRPGATLIAFGIVAVWFLVVWSMRNTPPLEVKDPEPDIPPLTTNYGDASFSTPDNYITTGMSSFGGVFFGKSSSPNNCHIHNLGAPVCSEPENHTLIVARTRTGKGTRVIVPTLLKGSLQSSCVVIDPKGENAAITARARAAYQHVHIINPWGVLAPTFQKLGFTTATYNPLDALDPEDPNSVKVAQQFVATISPAEPGKDEFWKGSAGDLLAAVLLYIAYDPQEQKTLARAREITSLDRKGLQKYIYKMVAVQAYGGGIRQLVTQFIDLANDTYTGITSNLNRVMAFLTDPRIREATASSSFSMADLTGLGGQDRPTTVYIVAPTGALKTQKVWLRLLISSVIATFGEKPEGKKGYRCNVILDEFANLGFIDEMPNEITFAAGNGIDFTLVIQDFKQLRKIYGDDETTIINNCAYKWFCNVGDNETAKYLSESLGKKTVRTVTKGESTGETKGMQSVSEREGKSTTYGEMGKDLLSPSEIIRLGKDVAILLAPGSRPHYVCPVDYWNLPEAFNNFREQAPALFWEPPLFYDANPLVSGSRGTGGVPQTAPQYRTATKSNFDPLEYAPKEMRTQVPQPQPQRPPIDWMLYSPLRQQAQQPPAQPQQPPAAQAPQEQKKGSSNYDPTYYSDENIEKRKKEAARKKPPGDSADPKGETPPW